MATKAEKSPTGAPLAKAPDAVKPAETTRSRRVIEMIPTGPRYELLEDSYLDNVYRKKGDTVVYLGEPGSALKPINDEAKKRKQAVRNIRLDPKLDPAAKKAALRELSDEWNGVEVEDRLRDSEADLDDDLPDTDATDE
jgi:hypothetical protein